LKVLLVSANLERCPFPVFPIGLSYVARAIEKEHEVGFHDCAMDGEDGLQDAIARFGPEVVGMGLRNVDDARPGGSLYLGDYRRIVRIVKSSCDAPLVLGGSAFTLFPDEYMAALYADFGIKGEGEHLAVFLRDLERGNDPSHVPGLFQRDGRKTPHRHFNGSVGHGKAAEQYLAPYFEKGGMASLQTRRGCNQKCVYCPYPLVEGRLLRPHPVGDIVDEIERLVSLGLSYLFFVDSMLNIDTEHTAAMAEEIIRRDIHVSWAAYMAPFRISADYAGLLKASGLTHVEFGTESLCDEVLDASRKPFTFNDIREAHDNLGTAGVHRAHFLLLGGPGETKETVDETFAAAGDLKKTIFFPATTLRVFPGTELHSIAIKEGVIGRQDSLFDPVFYSTPSISDEWLKDRIEAEAANNPRLVTDAKVAENAPRVAWLYAAGHTGPMWEHLISE